MRIALRLLACLAVLAAPVPGIAREITVFAAASLRGALDEVAAGFPQPVVLSYAASSALARQIAAGAPADVFVSANPDWMDRVATNLVARQDLLTNRLVIVGEAGADPIEVTDLPGRLGNGRLAMALVDAVPAGIYGRAALASLGVWDAVEDRVAQADNVRAALALVALGATPFGVVYSTDAAADLRVAVVAEFPAGAHPPISYPAAALTDAGLPFFEHLQDEAAAEIFARHGFGLARN